MKILKASFKKDINMIEKVQNHTTKLGLVVGLEKLAYKERLDKRGLTDLVDERLT